MADETNAPETQNQTEEEISIQDEPAPVLNGNGNHAPAPARASGQAIPDGAILTAKWTKTATADPLLNRVNRSSAQTNEKAKNDQAYLNALMVKAEANDYLLVVNRIMPPVNADGDEVPTGRLDGNFPVMYYEDLVDSIAQAWGGGSYRVSFTDTAGRRVPELDRGLIVNINTITYPVKKTKYEKIESKSSSKGVAIEEDTDAKQRERELKALIDEDRRQQKLYEITQAKREREYRDQKRELELEQMRRSMTPQRDEKSAELIILEKRLEEEKLARIEAARKADEDRKERDRKYEDDKKEAQRRADDDRKMFADMMSKMAEKISDVANRPAPPKEDTFEKLVALVGPIAMAYAQRPAPALPPPDNSSKELMMEMHKSTASIVSAALTKPPVDNSRDDRMFDAILKISQKENSTRDAMITGLMQAALTKDKSQALTPELIFKLQDMGEERMSRMLQMQQGMGGGGGEEGSDYDAKLGFLGNAGKAIFSGLKSLMESAATNPGVQQLLMSLVGKRNPSNAELAQQAYRMEQQQQAQIMPPPALAYQPADQQFIPAGPPPLYPQQQQPSFQGPPPIAQPRVTTNPNPPQIHPTQQQQVANEFESEASGLPGNGDPAPEPTPEEKAIEHLYNEVSEAVSICVTEAAAKSAVRTWPSYALDHWNKEFLENIKNMTTNGSRAQAIQQKCDPTVFAQLARLVQSDPNELNLFWQGVNLLVDKYMKAQAIAQAAPTPAPTPQPQPPVTTQPVQSEPPAAPIQ